MTDKTWYIHVNQHIIRRNISSDHPEPPIAVRTKHGKSAYAFRVSIPDGSSLRYSPRTPILDCGARLVIECPSEPEILE